MGLPNADELRWLVIDFEERQHLTKDQFRRQGLARHDPTFARRQRSATMPVMWLTPVLEPSKYRTDLGTLRQSLQIAAAAACYYSGWRSVK